MARKDNLNIKIEPFIYEKIQAEATLREISLSAYVRRLLVQHLIDNGMLKQEELQKLVIGV